VPPAAPTVTKTGFQACWLREPGIDAPWGGPDLRLAALTQHLADVEAVMHATQDETARVKARLVEVETALANVAQCGLDAGDRDALDRLRRMIGTA
jgi:hypothetical protein